MEDYIIAAAFITFGIYFFFFRKSEDEIIAEEDMIVDPNSLKNAEEDELDVGVTKQYNIPKGDVSQLTVPDNFPQEVEIYFGSQTGTAEKFSRILEEEGNDLGIIAKVVDMEDFDKEEFINVELAILVVATHGEGDPTDNALRMHTWLKKAAKKKETELAKNVNFTVFALGDTEYEKYCASGKFFDQKLEIIGAKRVFEIGLGDSSTDLETDFSTWKAKLWPGLIEHWKSIAPAGSSNMKRKVSKKPKVKYPLVMGEPQEENEDFPIQPLCIRQYVSGKDVKIESMRELKQTRKYGSCLEVIYDLEGTDLEYHTAANLAVFPENNQEDVDRIIKRFELEKEKEFIFKNAEGDNEKRKHPFPTPCTVGEALTKYCELRGPVDRKIFHDLSQYATEEEDKKELERLSQNDATEDIEAMKQEFTNIIDIMEEYKSIDMSCAVLLQLIPKMMPRYYTIASSARLSPTKVRMAISLSEITSKKGKKFKGITSEYIERIFKSGYEDGSKTNFTSRIFIKDSLFKYPEDPSTPIIMVGPGTGVVPFIAFAEERQILRNQNPDIKLGGASLYFGCRERSEDYIYRDEITQFKADNQNNHVYEAFSREHEDKVYVQDLLKKNIEETKEYILNQNGHFYM